MRALIDMTTAGRPRLPLYALVLLLGLGAVQEAAGQSTRYAVAIRDVPLADALEQFVDLTGAPIAYDPKLVTAAERVFCVARTDEPEALLSCILRETSLDYFRLSSGTYSLVRRAESRPAFGRLAGTVTDNDTGNPVAYAHISVAENGAAAASNLAGHFVLPPLLPGPYTLLVTHVNYGTYRQEVVVTPDGRDHIHIPVHAHPVVFSPVIIDGGRQRARADAVQAARSVPPEELEAAPLPLHRRSAGIPGVRVNDVTADVYIQAGEPGDHQLRLDGVPIFLPRHMLGLFGAFSPFSIGSLTVHRAGFDADVGSQIAGVIDARHLLGSNRSLDFQADPMSLSGRIELGTGRRDSRDFGTSISARVRNDFAWTPPWISDYLKARGRPDDFLMVAPVRLQAGLPGEVTPILSFERDLTPQVTFHDLHFASRIRIGPLRSLYLSGYRGEQRLGGRLSQRIGALEPETRGSWISVDDDYQWSNVALQGTYSAVLSSRSLFAVQARFSDYAHRYRHLLMENLFVRRAFAASVGSDFGYSVYPARDRNHIREIGATATLDYLSGAHHLEGGLEVTRTTSGFDFYISDVPRLVQLQGDDERHWFDARRVMVDHAYRAWRIAAFGQDRMTLGARAALTLGLRLTYLPETGVAYAEPRAALTFTGEAAAGEWSSSTRAGIYRQFVTQHDVSSLDAGALLPTLRIWLPLDGSVRPPLAYHVAQGVSIRPSERIEIAAEAYGRIQPHALMIDYRVAAGAGQAALSAQAEVTAPAELVAAGASLSATATLAGLKLRGGYEYSYLTRRSNAVFEGRWESVPWNEPHRLHAAADLVPNRRTTVGLRWQASAGRSWAFRQAYYDFFSGRAEYAALIPVDLGRPSAHVLPVRHQLDVTAAYTVNIGPAELQARAEILNALNRRNVDEWRLHESEDGFKTVPLASYGRLPSLALRLTW